MVFGTLQVFTVFGGIQGTYRFKYTFVVYSRPLAIQPSMYVFCDFKKCLDNGQHITYRLNTMFAWSEITLSSQKSLCNQAYLTW